MDKTKFTKFEQLEKLNIEIDIWIDSEEYQHFTPDNNGNPTFLLDSDEKVGQKVTELFSESATYTHDKDSDWNTALRYTFPVTSANGQKLDKTDPLEACWSHLFFAKLLRAKILQKSSSDCYTRRLDDVVAYLERHLPLVPQDNAIEKREQFRRLFIVYLLELSAAAQGWESMGFSERVRRVIRDAEYSLDKNCENNKAENKLYEAKAPYQFYELWAGYNIGVAYFHRRDYRKAVLEFNRIIWQVKKWNEKKNKDDGSKTYLKFFNTFTTDDGKGEKEESIGRQLLLLPAKLYRAEVQLKIQLAYHALKTLNRHEKEKENSGKEFDGWGSKHNQIRAEIIRTQAYQQFGRLDESWKSLSKIYGLLFGNSADIKNRCDCEFRVDVDNTEKLGLRERFIDILIEDHLQWLRLEGEAKDKVNENLRHLVKYGKDRDFYKRFCVPERSHDQIQWETYLKNLQEAFVKYWNQIQFNGENRNGYFQQVAKYLAWLAEAADTLKRYAKDCKSEEVQELQGHINKIAKELYHCKLDGEVELQELILEEEPGLANNADKDKAGKKKCVYCDPKGIDLRRIEGEHYAWFQEAMLKFFDLDEHNKKLVENKQRFVRRLGKLERIERDDLRINDLNLRYECFGPEDLLDGFFSCLKYRAACRLCWPGVKSASEFQLLQCGRPYTDKGKQDEYDLAGDDYERIIARWHEDYYHQLEQPTAHERQKKGFYFLGLRRWNSSSPAKGYSTGGGYLIYHLNKGRVDMGIAIDPGFDFVRNLFHSGFGLDDIDIVLISHAHLDHIRDFESITTLLFELKKRTKREKRVHVILSLGAYRRLKHIVEDPSYRYLIEPYVIDINREIDEDYFENLGPCRESDKQDPLCFEFVGPIQTEEGNKKNTAGPQIERFEAVLPGLNNGDKRSNNDRLHLSIIPTRAYHRDFSDSDSFGFLIEVKGRSVNDHPEKVTFGYTGDTKWVYPDMEDPFNNKDERRFKDIALQYHHCDALVVHLGSLIKGNDDTEYQFDEYTQCRKKDGYPCEKLVRKENHSYLVGMLRLLTKFNSHLPVREEDHKPLILVGEFGEELKGNIRIDLTRRLQKVYGDKLAILPVDVGINVRLHSKEKSPEPNKGNTNIKTTNRCNCTIWCVQCNNFVQISEADFALYGPDHAMFCVCETCKKSTPPDVLQNRLRQLYEVGVEVRVSQKEDC